MAEAARLAPDRPTWVLALRQTGGRGRRGRAWHDPPGNFAATLALPLDRPAPEAALYSFVAALALHDTVAGLMRLPPDASGASLPPSSFLKYPRGESPQATGGRRPPDTLGAGRPPPPAAPSPSPRDPVEGPSRLALKWPNDLLFDGGKLAGILLESAGMGARVHRLAIGIGVNLAAAPPAEPGAVPPVSLAQAGVTIAPEAFLDRLAPAFAARAAQLSRDGFPAIRADWLARAARLGERVMARTARETVQGRFETLDDTGALVLATDEGRRIIPAGEVYF